MEFPILIASGQGVIPVIFIGIPAAIAGVLCLVFGVVRSRRETFDPTKPERLVVLGVVLLVFALFTPTMDPLIFWVFDRLFPAK